MQVKLSGFETKQWDQVDPVRHIPAEKYYTLSALTGSDKARSGSKGQCQEDSGRLLTSWSWSTSVVLKSQSSRQTDSIIASAGRGNQHHFPHVLPLFASLRARNKMNNPSTFEGWRQGQMGSCRRGQSFSRGRWKVLEMECGDSRATM